MGSQSFAAGKDVATNKGHTMAKYHLTGEGKVAPCRARVRACPRGQHFPSKEVAGFYVEQLATSTLPASPAELIQDERHTEMLQELTRTILAANEKDDHLWEGSPFSGVLAEQKRQGTRGMG